jgi:hypothetical protein
MIGAAAAAHMQAGHAPKLEVRASVAIDEVRGDAVRDHEAQDRGSRRATP